MLCVGLDDTSCPEADMKCNGHAEKQYCCGEGYDCGPDSETSCVKQEDLQEYHPIPHTLCPGLTLYSSTCCKNPQGGRMLKMQLAVMIITNAVLATSDSWS